MERTDGRSLRVGILCDGTVFQRWQAESIRGVRAVSGVELVVLVVNDPHPAPAPKMLEGLWQRPWRTALYRRYRHKRFKPAAMDPVDLSTELAHVPLMRCRAEERGHSQYFDAEDLAALRAMQPDVLLRFGFNILRGEVLQVPRFGIWSFHHGDEEKYRGGPPGFWEIMNGEPVTGAILQRITDRLDGGIVLRKGWFNTVDHSLSDTVNNVLTHTAHWPAQVCRELLDGRTAVVDGAASRTNARVYRYPGNLDFLRFLGKQAANKARFHQQELRRHEEWNIGVLYQPIASLLGEKPSLNVRWIPSPSKGAYRADPFGYMGADGQLNVLYEKYDYATGTGSIGRIRPKRDNILKRSRTMLNDGSHFSYPYIVERDGSVYVIPENAASGRVDRYRVNEANEALEFVDTLLDEPLYDPTLFEHEGRWWLFGTKSPLTNVALYAYFSDTPFGPFAPHAMNPIKMDVRSARPAGTPFVHEGALYRPGQDSSITYGRRIALNRVHELTPTAFREEVVRFVGPIKGSYAQGMHTLCALGPITLVDGKRWTFSSAQEKRVRRRKWGTLRKNEGDNEGNVRQEDNAEDGGNEDDDR